MGGSSSKIDEDKALLLCKERKHFVRQALDGRCLLAAAHASYIRSLRSTGTALRKFVEPEASAESFLYTSTSATHEPLALTEKSLSQFSYSSPSPSQQVEAIETHSPSVSPPRSSQIQANYMKSKFGFSKTIKEKPSFHVTETVRSSSSTPRSSKSESVETPILEPPPLPPGTTYWDYFDFSNSDDNRVPFEERRTLNQGWDDSDDIRGLREEEGVPDLEEEGEKISFIGRAKDHESRHEFDEHFVDPAIQKSGKQNVGNETKEKDIDNDGDDDIEHDGDDSTDESPDVIPSKDLLSSIRDIEYQFHRASESGQEIPRMLEASKIHYRPVVTEIKERKSMASKYFTACLVCCGDTTLVPPDPTPNTTKYLTWNRSVSSCSSTSKNPVGSILKDGVDDSSNDCVANFFMNSGSHASTLDRLYAWEKKLYDEVKASGFIRREYDAKCKALRHHELNCENSQKIDKTRAIVKDLHSRIQVAIHRIDSISKRIEELRDKELQPQLVELIEGLSRMWETMLQCHRIQRKIIMTAYLTGTSKILIQSEARRQTTIDLECELNSLGTNFTKWITAHKSYLQALNGWLLKCVLTVRQKSARGRKMQFSPRRDRAPPIFITCRNWPKELEALPTKEVANAIRDLAIETRRFLPHQGKVGEKKSSKFSSSSSGMGDQRGGRNENLLDVETEAPENWESDFNTIKPSLLSIFKRLVKFSKSSSKMYKELRVAIQEAQMAYDRSAKV